MPGIPISALGFVCPALCRRNSQLSRGRASRTYSAVERSLEFKRSSSWRWLLPVILLMPCVALATLLVMRAAHIAHAAPHFPLPASLILFAAFFVAALGEEMGWSGYAIDPMQQRWAALRASIVLGIIWAAWHIVAMVQTGQSPSWIAWGCLDMVATRVIMVWIYNNTRRTVLAVVVFHAIANVTFKSVFPGGSYESERILSVLLTIIAVVVTLIFGARADTLKHEAGAIWAPTRALIQPAAPCSTRASPVARSHPPGRVSPVPRLSHCSTPPTRPADLTAPNYYYGGGWHVRCAYAPQKRPNATGSFSRVLPLNEPTPTPRRSSSYCPFQGSRCCQFPIRKSSSKRCPTEPYFSPRTTRSISV